MQQAPKKTYNVTPESLDKLNDTRNTALSIINEHLLGTVRKIERMGYRRTELAMAYLILAYHALRHNKPKEKARDTFNVLAHFAIHHIENGVERKTRMKLSKLH